MIYGPDDKPIVNPVRKAMNATMEKWYNRTTLEALQKKFCFTDWWGPTLYDARGNRIEWPNRMAGKVVPVKTGRTIQFERRSDRPWNSYNFGDNQEDLGGGDEG